MGCKRKYSARIALILALSLLLTSCGIFKDPVDNEETSTALTNVNVSTSVFAKPHNLSPVTLSWYIFMDRKMRDEDMVVAEINRYLGEKINLTLNLNILTGDDFSTRMPLIIASGQPYDICFSASWSNSYNENVARGAFLEITEELLNRYALETRNFIPKVIWDGIKINNRIYGIPTYKETGHQYGYFINKNIADRYGFDLSTIHKWDDIEPMYQKIKEKEPDILCNPGDNLYNAALPHEHVTGDWDLPGVLNVGNMETYARNDDNVFNQYETKEYRYFVNTMRKWMEAGYFLVNRKDEVTNGYREYLAGKEFSFPIYYAPEFEKTFSKTTGIPTAYVPFYPPILETADLTGSGLNAISKTSSNPERALMLLNLVNTDIKLGTFLRHGIENIHYKMVGKQLDRTAVPGIDVRNHPYDYVYGWQFGSPFNQIWDVSYPENIMEIFIKYNRSAKTTRAFGFSFDPTPVQNNIAALQSVLHQYADALNLGYVDPGQCLPEFIEKLKINGVDAFIKEVQRQLNVWKQNSGNAS